MPKIELGENEVLAMNAGHRERAALLLYWNREVDAGRIVGLQMPFWKYIETVRYDARYDHFILPDAVVVTVATCNQIAEPS